jgi:hypothetical protein
VSVLSIACGLCSALCISNRPRRGPRRRPRGRLVVEDRSGLREWKEEVSKRREFRLDHRETAEDEGRRRGGLGQQVSAYGGRRSSWSSTSSIVSLVFVPHCGAREIVS